MQQMKYNAPNRMYVFQNPPTPFWCCDAEPDLLPTKILAARLQCSIFLEEVLSSSNTSASLSVTTDSVLP